MDNKKYAKLAAQDYRHVEIFLKSMERVGKMHDGILQDPYIVWNMDETAVDATEGKLQRASTTYKSKNVGKRGIKANYGVSKHVIAVVTALAAGIITPIFFVIEGKRINSDSWPSVTGLFKDRTTLIIERYTKDNWFPFNGSINVS